MYTTFQRKYRVSSQPSCDIPESATVHQAAEGVKIDGMTKVLPAGATSCDDVQRTVVCGLSAIGQVPTARWDVTVQPALSEPIASRVRHAGFVRNADLADNAAFRVSPAEAAATTGAETPAGQAVQRRHRGRAHLPVGVLQLCGNSRSVRCELHRLQAHLLVVHPPLLRRPPTRRPRRASPRST